MSRQIEANRILNAIRNLVSQTPSKGHNEIRIVVAMERVVARLESHKELFEHITFKGGFVLLKNFNSPRFTRDIDALARNLTKKKLKSLITEALENNLHDGLWFGNIQFKEIELQGGYGGLRISFSFQIGDPPANSLKQKKLSRLHLDLSFEDFIFHAKVETMASVIAEIKPISWKIYPIEYIVAEKLDALFSRGSMSSRAKDIFDLNFLIPQVKNKSSLREAITIVFQKRPTEIPTSFFKTAEQFDLRILRDSWPSVEIDTNAQNFNKHWLMFLDNLKNIDSF
jgi:predicted nucleotidyltransferase component of viral defense system